MADTALHRHFAIVIPAYNHAGSLKEVIGKAIDTGLSVIVVDDGSDDDSARILSEMDGPIIINHSHNRGKGAALTTGLAMAEGMADFAITIDADGQHDPADALSLINAYDPQQRSIMIGSRKGMTTGGNVGWTSRFGRGFSNFWVRASGGPIVSDTQSGFRIYPIRETLSLNTRSKRFQFEVEVLALAAWADIPITEAPVDVHYPPKNKRISHFRPFVDFWRNFFTFSRLITMRILIPISLRRKWATR